MTARFRDVSVRLEGDVYDAARAAAERSGVAVDVMIAQLVRDQLLSAPGGGGRGTGPLADEETQVLEELFPELAEAAVRRAYRRALAAGSTVLVRDGDDLVEVSPDGTRRVVRPLPPALRATVGEQRDLP